MRFSKVQGLSCRWIIATLNIPKSTFKWIVKRFREICDVENKPKCGCSMIFYSCDECKMVLMLNMFGNGIATFVGWEM